MNRCYSKRNISASLVCCLIASVVVFFGCNKPTSANLNSNTDDNANLVRLAMAYKQFLGRGNSPRNVNDLIPILKEIGDPQKILCSTRDGLPYVIVWGVDFKAMGRGTRSAASLPIIAYEQQGKNGKRLAIGLGGVVKEYTNEEFSRLNIPPNAASRK